MQKLYDWKAQRSGTRLRIVAKTAADEAIKVTKVETIEVLQGRIVAIDTDGAAFDLGAPSVREVVHG